ncbi:MAG TPA: hypothetical protein VMF13_00815 [Luteitalea sp.]|nr:hypothetical protein [Luteitalea sp.]
MPDAIVDKLADLGFVFVHRSFATPALRLELALREFQTYARLEHAARIVDQSRPVYADRLASHPLTPTQRLAEQVTGELTDRTKELIDVWHAAGLRCPVVVECWRAARITVNTTAWWGRVADRPVAENVWLWNEAKEYDAHTKGRRLFVRDFTKHYDTDAHYSAFKDGGDRLLLGRHNYAPPRDGEKAQDGPMSGLGERALPVTPERLTGDRYDLLSREGRTTYRVVRAVAEVECGGFFDSINCWDDALLSLGLCHWTLARLDKGKVSLGELEAFLAFARQEDANTLPITFKESDVAPADAWLSPAMLNRDQRKYNSRLKHVVLKNQVATSELVPMDTDRLNFFRSWHWFHRYLMATRTKVSLQRAMWKMARFRLRDIGAAPAGAGIKRKGGAPARLSDVFTSEQSAVLLMEWHVLSPSTMLADGKPTGRLAHAIKSARIDLAKPTDDWKDDEEARLLVALKANCGARILRRFDQAFSCGALQSLPHPDDPTGRKLSARRNSFALDTTGLGASPF